MIEGTNQEKNTKTKVMIVGTNGEKHKEEGDDNKCELRENIRKE